MPNIIVKHYTVLNPATLLPTDVDGEPHGCVATITETCSPRPDLMDTPLPNADLELFVDGSASRDPTTGKIHAGYAVVTQHETLKAEPLTHHFSAQAAGM